MTKVKCWEFSGCTKRECPAFRSPNLSCWLLSGGYCREKPKDKSSEKPDVCLSCDVFRKNMDLRSARKTFEAVNVQIARYKEAAKSSERDLQSMSTELAIGLSEVFEALKMIAAGDPEVRIDERSPVALIEKLKHLVNVTAENIGEIVDQSHEFAMWLAEHFDVLHKVTNGELRARVSGKSRMELLESLKKVTNDMIESVEREIINRERAENALRESEERLRSFFNSVTDFMFILDKEGIITQVNPAVLQVRRHSKSVCVNLAEAWRRQEQGAALVSKLSDAAEAASRAQNCLEFATKYNYIDKEVFARIDSRYEEIFEDIFAMLCNGRRSRYLPEEQMQLCCSEKSA